MTIDHAALISEMPHIEQMPTQERLILARERRTKQLQSYHRREREYGKKPKGARSSAKRRVNFRDSVVLLEAAARNDIDEVRNLLFRGVDPDSCNEDGLTALHQCCIDDNEAMLLLLLEQGANVNAVDSEKWTPLHAAATCGHLKLVSILIARGANLLAVNADGNMPYDICEDEATLDYIEGEMAKRGVTQKLIDETRAHTEMQMLIDLQKLAAKGEDLENCDKQGATPLHVAAANGYTTVVEYLLDQNVRTDVKDRDDWQPAHAAACWGHLDVLEMLVQAGADLNAKNKYDETPADICEDPEIKERIIQLRTEQESKRQAAAHRKKVKKSSSNTRTQSVRRTSLRDKGLTQRRDAVEEARLRMQAEYKEKNESKERKRNILYLILSYLREQNLQDSANSLASEAQLTNQFEVCDNVDLDIVLQDYQSYYITKFNKPPRIVKKVVSDEAALAKTVQMQKKKLKSAFTACSNEKISQQKTHPESRCTSANNQEAADNFRINVKALGRQISQDNDAPKEADYILGYEERRSAKEFCDFKNYNQEWRDMADLIVREVVPKDLGVSWNDCIGLESSIEVLKEAVVYPVKYPRIFTGLVAPWKGVLLFGPPGTGKTQLAKATACESSTTFITVRSSSFVSKWRGESEKMLKILFEMAKFYQPTTIFIDEIDAVASKFEDSQHDASRRFKSELLIEMDGILNGNEQVFVLATTNSPWNLDPALLRRFEKRILLDTPSKEARRELFRYFFSKHGDSFQESDFSEMARLTEYFSGSDIKGICKEVVMNIVREKLRNSNIEDSNAGNATGYQIRKPVLQDVLQAIERASATTNSVSLERYSTWGKNYGCN